MSFTCHYSDLEVERRVYLPGKRNKTGIFADLNCALAWLHKHRPRNWRKKIQHIQRLLPNIAVNDVYLPPDDGSWQLHDDRRIVPEQMSQTRAEYDREMRPPPQVTGIKRKAEIEPPPLPPPPPVPQKRFKVTIDDEGRQRTFFTDDWRGEVMKTYELGHAIPAYFTSNGCYVLHPLLACDGKSVKATPCSITVELSTPHIKSS